MDKWKESELAKMKAGGNANMKSFLEDRSAPGGNIQTKYNSKQAALYKDKILTESQGGFWDEDKSPAQKHVGSLGGGGLKTSSQNSSSSYARSSGSDSFDSSSNGFSKSHTVDSFGGYQGGGGAAGGDSGLPPSQGGRYSGFGNTDYNPSANRSNSVDNIYESSLGTLTNSWSAFSIGASKLGQSMTEASKKVGEVASQKLDEVSGTVSEKVKDGQVLSELSAKATSVAGMVGAASKSGWSNLSSLWNQQSSYQQPSEQSGFFDSSGGSGGYNSSSNYQQHSSGGSGASRGGYQEDWASKEDWGSKDDWGGFDDEGTSKTVKSVGAKSKSSRAKKNDDDEKLIDFGFDDSKSAQKKSDNGFAEDNWDNDDW